MLISTGIDKIHGPHARIIHDTHQREMLGPIAIHFDSGQSLYLNRQEARQMIHTLSDALDEFDNGI